MAAPDGIVHASVTEDQGLRRLDEMGWTRRWRGSARTDERGASVWAMVAGEEGGG